MSPNSETRTPQIREEEAQTKKAEGCKAEGPSKQGMDTPKQGRRTLQTRVKDLPFGLVLGNLRVRYCVEEHVFKLRTDRLAKRLVRRVVHQMGHNHKH